MDPSTQSAQWGFASQKEQLNNLLGRDVRTEFNFSDGVEAVIYSIFVLDLKLVKWEKPVEHGSAGHVPEMETSAPR